MLKYILGDMSFDAFKADYFEKKPLFIRGGSKLGEEFGIKDFDQYLISGEGMLQNRVRISKNQTSVMIPSFAGVSETQREFVLTQFKEGATLKLEDLDSRDEAMSRLCKALEEVFGGYCFAKPFLTGSGFQGLSVHFDTTEVFVVQLEGSKSWKVWPKYVHNPTLPMQTTLEQSDLGEPEIQVVLKAGDILYIPAGTPHSAECMDDYSLHMSIGLSPVKLFEVIEGYIRIISEHIEALRTNVYPFSNFNELEEKAATFLQKLTDVSFARMHDDFKIAYSAVKHETCNARLLAIAQGEKLSAESNIRLRVGADVNIREKDSILSIYYSSTISPGKALISTPTALQMPGFCKSAIAFIQTSNGTIFNPSALPDELDAESKIILCKELLGVGILVYA
jgi:ribosomal protein L16 Arg81 hydroxylase